MQAAGEKQVINLLRCAWAGGSQKYGALVLVRRYPLLLPFSRNQWFAGAEHGIAVIPWWTTDIGGFLLRQHA